jgi:uncharacterized protein (TIGR03067 family)
MRKAFAVALTVGFLALGCERRSDQEIIQGDWELREMWGEFTFDLSAFRNDDREILTFKGNAFSYTNNVQSGKRVSGTFTCDPMKNPKEITFTIGERAIVAIYSLSDEALTICVGEKDNVPPSIFRGGPGARPALIHFRRPTPRAAPNDSGR